MIIVNLDFTTTERARKIVNVVNRWYRKASSLSDFAEKLRRVTF